MTQCSSASDRENTAKSKGPTGSEMFDVFTKSTDSGSPHTATGKRVVIMLRAAALTEPSRHGFEPRLVGLVARFALVSLSLSALAVPLYGFLRGHWLDALLSGIALGMSMLPEEFPLVLTVFMVMGAWRISRARVLTRRVAAIETLGAATVLCTDKTGTLTQNRLTIVELRIEREVWQARTAKDLSEPFAAIVRYGVLASATDPFDPMDKAFYALAAERLHDIAEARAKPTLCWEYGLRPDLLCVTNVWQQADKDGLIAAAKGRQRQ